MFLFTVCDVPPGKLKVTYVAYDISIGRCWPRGFFLNRVIYITFSQDEILLSKEIARRNREASEKDR